MIMRKIIMVMITQRIITMRTIVLIITKIMIMIHSDANDHEIN